MHCVTAGVVCSDEAAPRSNTEKYYDDWPDRRPVKLKSPVVWQTRQRAVREVEATKFTKLGYVGKEVDSIIRDLTDAAVKMVRITGYREKSLSCGRLAEERILDVLITRKNNWGGGRTAAGNCAARSNFRKNCAKASSTIKRSRLTSPPRRWA